MDHRLGQSNAVRVEDAGWTLDITRGWLDTFEGPVGASGVVDAVPPLLVDHLPPREGDTGYLQVAATVPGAPGPSLIVILGFYRMDGDSGAGVVLVPETRRLFVAGGNRAICYHHDGDRWWRQWEREVEVTVWGLARHGDVIVMSSELEVVAWDTRAIRRLTAGVEPPWSYEIRGNRMRLDIDGAITMVDIPAG